MSGWADGRENNPTPPPSLGGQVRKDHPTQGSGWEHDHWPTQDETLILLWSTTSVAGRVAFAIQTNFNNHWRNSSLCPSHSDKYVNVPFPKEKAPSSEGRHFHFMSQETDIFSSCPPCARKKCTHQLSTLMLCNASFPISTEAWCYTVTKPSPPLYTVSDLSTVQYPVIQLNPFPVLYLVIL